MATVAVVERGPEKTASFWKYVASVDRLAWVDVVADLLAFFPEHRRVVLERASASGNRILNIRRRPQKTIISELDMDWIGSGLEKGPISNSSVRENLCNSCKNVNDCFLEIGENFTYNFRDNSSLFGLC